MIVVSLLSIHIMSEYWYHILICIRIKMMYFVALVEDIGHHVWWGRVDDRGRNNIRHVPRIFVLWDLELFVRVELANSAEVHIASKDGHTNGLGFGDVLQLLDEPIPFLLVVLRCPVIVKVVENLNAAIKLVHKATQQAGATHGLDRVH